MEFRQYIAQLADALGEAQLPLNPSWRKAAELVRADAVHYPLVKRIVAGLYKQARCSKPSDPLAIEDVLDYLGPLHYELVAEGGNDLDALALVERIGEISVLLFHAHGAAAREVAEAPRTPGQR